MFAFIRGLSETQGWLFLDVWTRLYWLSMMFEEDVSMNRGLIGQESWTRCLRSMFKHNIWRKDLNKGCLSKIFDFEDVWIISDKIEVISKSEEPTRMKKKNLLVICVEFLEKTVTEFLYYKIDNGNATLLSFDWYLLFRGKMLRYKWRWTN